MNSASCFLFVGLLALFVPINRCNGNPMDFGVDFDEIETGLEKPVLEQDEDLSSLSIRDQFEEFVKKYNKVYLSSQEKESRMEIFAKNLKRYEEMNAADMGTATYGVDQFSDMTADEFRQKMLTLNVDAYRKSATRVYDGPELHKKKQPKNFSWVDKGKVTPVKNQGYCGSCWAFSAVGNMESLYAIKHNKMETFSEQQIVDCDTTSDGCNGGWMSNAVVYVKNAPGLERDTDYPYRAYHQTCAFNKSLAVLHVKENVMLPQNEKKMSAYLFNNGPISVALDASAMSGYKGGIAHPPETACSKREENVNHGILLVGYGVYTVSLGGGKKKRLPYWIAKNSWGTSFGKKGYYYLYRGDGSCGIHTYPSSAVLK
nr:PREDICTED: putative cysteine proteinase CG12163 [Bemisia tabaci]